MRQPPEPDRTAKRRVAYGLVLAAGGVLLGVGLLFAVMIGSVPVSFDELTGVLAHRLTGGAAGDAPNVTTDSIIWVVRLPRVLLAATVGAMLAVAGVQLQGLFRNPLAAPGIIGTSQGAALGAVVALVTGLALRSILYLPLFSFIGAFMALLIIAGISVRGRRTSVGMLLLAGIALNFLLAAAIQLILSLSFKRWEVAIKVMTWMMGGLEGRGWLHVYFALPCLIVASAIAMWSARDLDLMLESEETAESLGVDVEAVKRYALATTALLTGAAVAIGGIIGFVGLVVPHMVRLLVGPGHARLYPSAAIVGAAFLVWADLGARLIIRPEEIRLGVVTAAVGAPFFLYLLVRHRRDAELI